MIKMREQIKPGETPERITVSMIDQDLKDGISKPEMATKYGIKPWEVDEMFKHPLLKGRRPSRKKALSFEFVDDTPQDAGVLDQIKEAVEEGDLTDPNQITLEDAIDEAIESVEEVKEVVKDVMEETEKIISSTTWEEDDEAEVDKEEEEIEMDDDTFEL